ncbi:MAG: DNA cytosine methyltransferase [Deltaproteobacteria bacterium]|nr:DNA cytosine methyltransferase [Deltaproteobacteria bacterium]MBW1910228.1 DNA cytosine methyltransferase [Deltaproteobacteria bacterium]MBW2032315.1 DNA cytosine methyltransferase [Deltaproteobacteria bacterium]
MKYETKNKTDNHRLVREEQRTYELRTDGKLARKRKRFRLIDAFAGAGGMTLGFSKRFGHAFDSVWANDFNNYCVETYNTNFGEHCLSGDIVDILNDPLANKIPEADVVIGGPPCQGFSLLNKNRQGDPRKQLWRPYFEIVERSGAKVFVMENVPQLLGSFEHGEIIGTAEAMGFKVWGDVLCAADYGVPQTRRRAFIIGCKLFDPALVFPPRKTHFNPNNNGKQLSIPFNQNDFLQEPQEWKNVRDAIEDLPMPEGTEIRNVPPPLDLHFGRNPTELSRKRYRAIPNEGMNRFDLQRIAPELTPKCWIRKKSGGTDLFGRLWWDRPAFTIRTEFYKPEKGRYLHPKQHRPITHREAARLQSFPDGFIFKGTKIEIAKQIGNAVPPLLAARVADVVYMLLTIKDH